MSKTFSDEIKNVPYPLPEGWKWIRLSEIAKINPETINPKEIFKDKKFTYIDINSVENFTGKVINRKEIIGNKAPSRARRLVRKNDVLLSTVRPYLMAHTIITNEKYDKQICSTGFSVLRSIENIYPKYLWYSLFANTLLSQYEKLMMGASYPALNNNQVQNLLISLPFKNNQPDLEKQKQIVEKIETIFEKIDKAITLRQKALEYAKKLFDSVLNKIFKEAEEDKKNWKWEMLSCALDKKAKYNLGKVKKKDYLMSGKYPIIDQGEKFIAGYFNDKNLLYNGKLPVIIVGDHTLNIKYVDFSFIQGADGLKILIPQNKIVYPKYLYFMLNFAKPKVKSYSRHWKIIKNLFIPLPINNNQQDLQKQKQIAEYLDNLHNKIKQLEELQKKQLDKLKQLKDSILSKAFKGELV